MKRELIAFEDPKSPVSEIFRTLRTNIQFAKKNGKMKSILVTSTYMGEGKSWTAANVAISFTQAGYKVLVIDADMRRGRQHSIFKIKQTPGLSNFLSNIDEFGNYKAHEIKECYQQTHIDNLYVMPLGNIPENPSELLLTEQMAESLEILEQYFDIIIVDAPPSTMVTDSVILSRLVDGVLIVVEQNKSKMDDLKKISKDIKNVGGYIIGVVLNKVSINKKKYESKYYYYGESSNSKRKKSDIGEILQKSDYKTNKENPRGNRFK